MKKVEVITHTGKGTARREIGRAKIAVPESVEEALDILGEEALLKLVIEGLKLDQHSKVRLAYTKKVKATAGAIFDLLDGMTMEQAKTFLQKTGKLSKTQIEEIIKVKYE